MTQLDDLAGWLKDGSIQDALDRQKFGAALDQLVKKVKVLKVSQVDPLATLAAAATWVPTGDHASLNPLEDAAKALATVSTKAHIDHLNGAHSPLDRVPTARMAATNHFKAVWGAPEAGFLSHRRLGKVLETISATEGLGAQMVSTAGTGLEALRIFPPTEKAAAQVKAVQAAITKETKALNKAGLTQPVVDFLLLWTEGKANLRDVLGAPLRWIQKNEVEDQFLFRS